MVKHYSSISFTGCKKKKKILANPCAGFFWTASCGGGASSSTPKEMIWQVKLVQWVAEQKAKDSPKVTTIPLLPSENVYPFKRLLCF